MITKPYNAVFKEIADGLLENAEFKQNYSDAAMLDVTMIFQSVFMDKIYNNQKHENINFRERLKMVDAAGNDLRKLIITYTGLDTHELAKL